MLRIVRLYQIVGNLVGKGEIPGGMIRRGLHISIEVLTRTRKLWIIDLHALANHLVGAISLIL